MITQQIWGTIILEASMVRSCWKLKSTETFYEVIGRLRVTGREQINPVTAEIKLILTHQK